MTAILDTTAFSAAMRNEPLMVEFLKARQPGNIATAPPVVAEIEYGIQRLDPTSEKGRLLDARKSRLLEHIKVLAWTPAASVLFGEIKAELERTGRLIDDFDIAIAAIARSHGAELVTANLAHFSRVAGLTARHWDNSIG